MSAINSASTNTEVEAAYDDNASYLEDASVAKCAAFMTAARILLRRLDSEVSDQGSAIKKNTNDIRAELDRATKWFDSNGNSRIETGRTSFTRGRAL